MAALGQLRAILLLFFMQYPRLPSQNLGGVVTPTDQELMKSSAYITLHCNAKYMTVHSVASFN